MPYTTHEEAITVRTGVPYNGFAHSFAGMGVQFLLFACIDLAIAAVDEAERAALEAWLAREDANSSQCEPQKSKTMA